MQTLVLCGKGERYTIFYKGLTILNHRKAPITAGVKEYCTAHLILAQPLIIKS